MTETLDTMGAPETLPMRADVATAKLEELDFEFLPGKPEDAGMPDLPDMPGMGAAPTAPTLPVLSLPEQAQADIDVPAAVLPEIFDLG